MTVTPHPLFEQSWPEGEYRFFQLGFVVDDLLAAAMNWTRVFGVGPFHIMPRGPMAYTYRGVPSAIDIQVGVAQAGPVQIELITQHTDGPSVFRDMNDRYGTGESGFHQLCTVTADYDGKKAHYQKLGYETVGEVDARSQRIAYVDTFAEFGFFTEVVEQTRSFLANLTSISRTCADWDGSDPVRLLRRGGYDTP